MVIRLSQKWTKKSNEASGLFTRRRIPGWRTSAGNTLSNRRHNFCSAVAPINWSGMIGMVRYIFGVRLNQLFLKFYLVERVGSHAHACKISQLRESFELIVWRIHCFLFRNARMLPWNLTASCALCFSHSKSDIGSLYICCNQCQSHWAKIVRKHVFQPGMLTRPEGPRLRPRPSRPRPGPPRPRPGPPRPGPRGWGLDPQGRGLDSRDRGRGLSSGHSRPSRGQLEVELAVPIYWI